MGRPPMRPPMGRPPFNRPRPNNLGFGLPFILGATLGTVINPYYRPYPSYPYYYF
jgi:hypothetical protein